MTISAYISELLSLFSQNTFFFHGTNCSPQYLESNWSGLHHYDSIRKLVQQNYGNVPLAGPRTKHPVQTENKIFVLHYTRFHIIPISAMRELKSQLWYNCTLWSSENTTKASILCTARQKFWWNNVTLTLHNLNLVLHRQKMITYLLSACQKTLCKKISSSKVKT